MKKGCFITLEGVEGSGKSTTIKFLAEHLQQAKVDFVLTREPGGTEIAEKIRQVILVHHQEKMHHDTEMLLYFAGRAQHFNQVIMPALKSGRWVICDRFTDATYAYQGAGRGISAERIAILENWVQGAVRPDYTLLFDLDVHVGMDRIKKNRYLDRIESEQECFFEKVRNNYLERAKREPKRFYVLNANQDLSAIRKQLVDIVQCWL